MSTRQTNLQPLQIDIVTNEPYLRLPKPLDNIIITPPHLSDAEALAGILSNPNITKWLAVIPKQYGQQDAEEWLEISSKQAENTLKELEESQEGALLIVGSCPMRALREVQVDGTQILIGSIGVGRSAFSYVEDVEESKRLADENTKRAVGDPDIVWEMGDYLAETHHGRGIMTAAIGTIIREWVIPRMGAHHIVAAPYLGNIGSVRVFEKNGFVLQGTTRRDTDIVTVSGERHLGQSVLRWDKDT